MTDTNRTTRAPKSASHRPVDEQPVDDRRAVLHDCDGWDSCPNPAHRPVDEQPVVDPLDIEDTLDLIQELINRVRRAVLERMEADQ